MDWYYRLCCKFKVEYLFQLFQSSGWKFEVKQNISYKKASLSLCETCALHHSWFKQMFGVSKYKTPKWTWVSISFPAKQSLPSQLPAQRPSHLSYLHCRFSGFNYPLCSVSHVSYLLCSFSVFYYLLCSFSDQSYLLCSFSDLSDIACCSVFL